MFKAAGLKGSSHRFRHTFAVELLLAGVDVSEVARMMGHNSSATTEKYYSAWVQARQKQMENSVRTAFTKMQMPGLAVEGTIQ